MDCSSLTSSATSRPAAFYVFLKDLTLYLSWWHHVTSLTKHSLSAFMTSWDVLDEVFDICQYDVMGCPWRSVSYLSVWRHVTSILNCDFYVYAAEEEQNWRNYFRLAESLSKTLLWRDPNTQTITIKKKAYFNNNNNNNNNNSYKALFSDQSKTHCAVQTSYDKKHTFLSILMGKHKSRANVRG